MNEPLTIRRERPDQPDVAALLSSLDAYLATLCPPQANHILDLQALLDPSVQFFVARQRDRAVGTAACRSMPGEAATGGVRYGEVKRMYVDPAVRGQGVGLQLLQQLEGALRDEGIALALLETGRDQAEAVRLYERAGYRPHPPFGGYPDNGLSVFYAKPL